MGCLGHLLGLIFGLIGGIIALVFGVLGSTLGVVFGVVGGLFGSVFGGLGILLGVVFPMIVLGAPVFVIIAVLWVLVQMFNSSGESSTERRRTGTRKRPIHRQPKKPHTPKSHLPIVKDDEEEYEVVDVDEWEDLPEEQDKSVDHSDQFHDDSNQDEDELD